MSRATAVFLLVAVIVVAILAIIGWIRATQTLRVHQATYKHTDDDLARARRQSVTQSHAVVNGKVLEHLAPLLPEFTTRFTPRDARFLGTPVDFVVFDGLDSGEGVREVVFVEVKTGKASLSVRERQVREAVRAGRVSFQLLRIPDLAASQGLAVRADGAGDSAAPTDGAGDSATFLP